MDAYEAQDHRSKNTHPVAKAILPSFPHFCYVSNPSEASGDFPDCLRGDLGRTGAATTRAKLGQRLACQQDHSIGSMQQGWLVLHDPNIHSPRQVAEAPGDVGTKERAAQVEQTPTQG